VSGGYQAKYYEQHWILKELIKEIKPQKILDVGCGFGRNIKFMIEECNIDPKQIYAFDFSENMLEKAKYFLGDNFEKLADIRQGDILNIPYKDEFDLVLCHGVLMHINFENELQAVKELKRVTTNFLICIEEYYEDKINKNINEFTYCHDYKRFFNDSEIILLKNKGLLMFKWSKNDKI
jgi:ubiquinone/menaquinone biosynthesis C-methylase UbiE